MSDVFDFESINKSIPKNRDTLALDTFHEALNSISSPKPSEDYSEPISSPNPSEEMQDYSEPEIADHTMEDVPIETEPTEEVQENEPEKTEPQQQKDQDQVPNEPQNGLVKVDNDISPSYWTQLGAKKALKNNSDNIVEVHLPIVMPWYHNLPYTLITYLHLMVNAGLVTLILWAMYIFVKDVVKEVQRGVAKLNREVAVCADLYIKNECHRGSVRPVLRAYCQELEECLDHRPEHQGHLVTGVRVLAQVLNGFVDSLSFKSLLIIFITLICVFASEYVFGYFRAYAYYKRQRLNTDRPHASLKMTPINVLHQDIYKH